MAEFNASPDSRIVAVPMKNPNIDVSNDIHKTYAVEHSAAQNTYQTVQSQNFSRSSVQFNVDPPSRNTFVSRNILTTIVFEITLTGTSAGVGVPLLQSFGAKTSAGVSSGNNNYDAPRNRPLTRAVSNIQVKINNDTINASTNTYERIFDWFHNNTENKELESISPNYNDTYHNYEETDGTIYHPLNSKWQSSGGRGRAGFNNYVITRNDSTGLPGDVAVVRLEVTGGLNLSPFLDIHADYVQPYLINVNTMSITLNLNGRGNGVFGGLIGSLMSHSRLSGSVFANGNVDVLAASCQMRFLTPDVLQNIPRSVTYAYYDPVLYPYQSNVPLAPGVTTTISMNNVQLNCTPQIIYLFVAKQDSLTTWEDTDTYLKINNINVTFDNQSSIFASASEYDLYKMAKECNCQMTWDQFSNDVGSIVAIKLPSHLTLSPTLGVGVQGSFQLLIKVQFTNQTNDPVLPVLNCLVVSEGTLTLDMNGCTRNVGPLNRDIILQTREMEPVDYVVSDNVYGGSWSGFKRFMRKVPGYLRKGLDVATKVAEVAAPQYSQALSRADQILKATGSGRRGRPRGRGLVGGAMLSRNELEDLM